MTNFKDYNFDCFIFHDVDLILEDDRCLYRCDGTPQDRLKLMDI